MLRYLVDPIFQVVNTAGKPATGGYVEVYLHGTRDKYYCASDFEGTLHPFKIPLDSLGANIILADDANAYDIYVYNRYGSLLMSRYNVAPVQGGGSEGGDAIGKVHFLKAVYDNLADMRAPYGYWIVDLEKPNPQSPYGYDYAMADEIIAKLSAGEIFVLSTYHTAPSPEEDMYIMCSSALQSREGHTAVRIWFAQMFAANRPEYMNFTTIYTPSMYNNNNTDTYYPEGRMAILNWRGQQDAYSEFRFMAYTELAEVATSGSYDDLNNKPNLALKEDVANKSQTIDATSTTEYPSSKAAADFVTSSIADIKTTTVRQNGQADNSKCPTEAAVRTAIDSAVSSAYHAAGSKTVAQLTSSLLVSANEGDVYNITDSGTTTSDFIEGAGLPISVGDNVVVCDVGGGVYKFDLLSGFVDLTNYLTKTGDGSDVTASFTAASTRTNVTTGEKMSALFGKVAKWFSDLKALAFKDKVNTSDIDDDAVTADKVKDGETLPVNISGYAILADTALKLPTAWGAFDAQTGYRLLATLTAPGAWNDRICTFNVFETRTGMSEPYGQLGTLTVQIRNNNGPVRYGASYCGKNLQNIDIVVMSNSDQSMSIYAYSSGSVYGGLQLVLASSSGYSGNPTGREGVTLYLNSSIQATVTGTPIAVSKAMIPLADSSGVGSATQPVYVDENGEIQPCTTLWNSIKNQISSNTVNVNQVDSNTETSSFVFVNNHVYHLTVHLQGSPLVTNSTSSGTGYVVAYIGSSLVHSHYSCKQSVDINSGELTAKDIKLPVNWKAENITGSSDNQIHVVVVFNNTSYGFSTASPYQLILQGTDFSGT